MALAGITTDGNQLSAILGSINPISSTGLSSSGITTGSGVTTKTAPRLSAQNTTRLRNALSRISSISTSEITESGAVITTTISVRVSRPGTPLLKTAMTEPEILTGLNAELDSLEKMVEDAYKAIQKEIAEGRSTDNVEKARLMIKNAREMIRNGNFAAAAKQIGRISALIQAGL